MKTETKKKKCRKHDFQPIRVACGDGFLGEEQYCTKCGKPPQGEVHTVVDVYPQ